MPKRSTGAKKKKAAAKSARRKKPSSPPKKRSSSKRVQFTRTDFDRFLKALSEEWRSLAGVVLRIEEHSLSKRSENSGDVSIMPLHPADIGGENYEQDFQLGLAEGNRTILREIRAAVRRIEEGTYGKCANCGGPIPKTRLNAAPWARYCIDCQSEFEQNGEF